MMCSCSSSSSELRTREYVLAGLVREELMLVLVRSRENSSAREGPPGMVRGVGARFDQTPLGHSRAASLQSGCEALAQDHRVSPPAILASTWPLIMGILSSRSPDGVDALEQ